MHSPTETSSLLPVAQVEEVQGELADAPRGRLFLEIARDATPVILAYALQNSLQTVSIIITGRLGPTELSSAAFALMLAFVSGWCVALGGATALDTLGSQSFTSNISPPTDLSILLQRCILLLWILLVPVCVMWAYAVTPILTLLGQPQYVAEDTQRFLRVLILGAPGYVAFESLKKYLQCQGIMSAATVVLIVVFPVNVFLNILLVDHLGLLGSPVALSITYWLSFLLLAIFTCHSTIHRSNGTWGGLQLKQALDVQGCIVFLKLAVPGVLMVGTEWAAFEIVALAAGRLGSLPLAGQSVIMTTDQILNTIPFGIGMAASTRVGNLIGSASATAVRKAAHMSALLSVITGAVIASLILATKDIFGYMFTDDHQVVNLVSQVMPLLASFQVADGLAGSCGGVLRGQGRQHVGAVFNLAGYYAMALPLGITLAFHPRFDLGLQGLWIGQVLALSFVGLGEYWVVWSTDWKQEIVKGLERNRQEAKRREPPALQGV